MTEIPDLRYATNHTNDIFTQIITAVGAIFAGITIGFTLTSYMIYPIKRIKDTNTQTDDSEFDSDSDSELSVFDSDSVFVTKNGKSYEKWAHKIEWSHFDFNAINRPNEIILVSKGGGVLYRFKDNAFERLDTSFEHRNKYRSYDFTFENKIYSYGGYGLFNVNSNLTFFNELNREWSEFLYDPNSKTPSPRQLVIGQVKDSFLYVACKRHA